MKTAADQPAFAVPQQYRDTGLTIRDYFAAHAPFTMADARKIWDEANPQPPTGRQLLEVLASIRTAYANAMVAARGQKD